MLFKSCAHYVQLINYKILLLIAHIIINNYFCFVLFLLHFSAHKHIFRENLLKKKRIHDKMFPQMCINTFNLQYIVIK
jgi:hypothetical protein